MVVNGWEVRREVKRPPGGCREVGRTAGRSGGCWEDMRFSLTGDRRFDVNLSRQSMAIRQRNCSGIQESCPAQAFQCILKKQIIRKVLALKAGWGGAGPWEEAAMAGSQQEVVVAGPRHPWQEVPATRCGSS